MDIRKALEQITMEQQDIVRMIGTVAMHEAPAGGGWAKEIEKAQTEESAKNTDYLRGFFDGLQEAYRVIAAMAGEHKGDDQ